jgi:hypothetical protein
MGQEYGKVLIYVIVNLNRFILFTLISGFCSNFLCFYLKDIVVIGEIIEIDYYCFQFLGLFSVFPHTPFWISFSF